MNDTELSQYICNTFEDVDTVIDSGNSFFFYNPDSSVPADHRLMFITLVTSDIYDQYSNLNRPSVFRLNIGIGKQTFQSLFGLPPRSSNRGKDAESDHYDSQYDLTALDQLMPHPEYARQYWICVLSPSDETFETKVSPLLAEAYQIAVSKYNRQHTTDSR